MCKLLKLGRNYSTKKSTAFFSTPIYYVNAEPHIGHLYSSLIADASSRWKRLVDKETEIIFSTGTDEHGTKIQRAAKFRGTTPNGYCDRISGLYRNLADKFNVGYTDFIRTSDDRHRRTVQKFWRCLADGGFIYKSAYQGWYCVSDETFLSQSQLKEIVKDGEKQLVSSESGHPVEWSEEQNYIFKLSAFKDDLLYWLKSNETAVIPHKFHKILLDMIHSEDALSDISVSRPASRVHWGIPVPEDDQQTVYVWLDALVNYLTAAGYSEGGNFERSWPPDVQVIGKDILKFHGIYWPAFLLAANLEPPRCILCHSHWTVDGEKMSKSKGNVVNPMERIDSFTSDGLRYFLLREGVNHSDGNYGDNKALTLLNTELADTLGNLLSRCSGKALNPLQIVPKMNPDNFREISSLEVTKALLEKIEQLPDTCQLHYDSFNFYKSCDAIIATLHKANLFFETMKPWELKKDPKRIEDLHVVLHLAMECLRVAGILLQPLIPNLSQLLLNKLSVPSDERYFKDSKMFSWKIDDLSEKPLGADKSLLFKRILIEGKSDKKAQNC